MSRIGRKSYFLDAEWGWSKGGRGLRSLKGKGEDTIEKRGRDCSLTERGKFLGIRDG